MNINSKILFQLFWMIEYLTENLVDPEVFK